ncbi:MAG: hypothetical protein WC710_06395 [Gallionella sp.]|jgi:hypothetical protein
MKTRLGIFIVALLLLPLAGFFISGGEWQQLTVATGSDDVIAGTLRTSIMLMIYVFLLNLIVKRMTGNAPLDTQRPYFIAVGAASAVLCWQLSFLNLFVASWVSPQDNPLLLQLMIYTPLFALLAPAILLTRALFASFPGLLKALNCRITFAAPNAETLARVLLAASLIGLTAGAVWPEKLYGLFWVAPLLLLTAMQLFWHEGTIFTGLKTGDWGRLVCTALAGIIVGNLAVISYQANALLDINLPNIWVAQAGLALFALTCLQLSDVLAEAWRGKSRQALYAGKKKFPIPVVVKK